MLHACYTHSIHLEGAWLLISPFIGHSHCEHTINPGRMSQSHWQRMFPKKGQKVKGPGRLVSVLLSPSSPPNPVPQCHLQLCSRLCVSWSPLPLCPISRRSLRSLPVASLTTPSVSAYNLHRHTLGTHLFYQSGRESNRPRKWEGSLRISTLLPSFQIHLVSLIPCSVANYHLCPLLSLCSQPGGLSRSQWNTLFPPFRRSTKNPLPSSKSASLSVSFQQQQRF